MLLPAQPIDGHLPDFLPGSFALERGSVDDFHALERFHYREGRPVSWTRIRRIVYRDSTRHIDKLVAVGVLSYPVLSCRLRERALGLEGLESRQRVDFVNANLRAVSRVIVHPQFRALGLATVMVRVLIDACPTRYVEALAAMGWAHPFFRRAGMREHLPDREGRPVYYLFDREAPRDAPRERGG